MNGGVLAGALTHPHQAILSTFVSTYIQPQNAQRGIAPLRPIVPAPTRHNRSSDRLGQPQAEWSETTLSVVALKSLGDHLKTGHTGSAENRPTELTQDNLIYTLPGRRWQ